MNHIDWDTHLILLIISVRIYSEIPTHHPPPPQPHSQMIIANTFRLSLVALLKSGHEHHQQGPLTIQFHPHQAPPATVTPTFLHICPHPLTITEVPSVLTTPFIIYAHLLSNTPEWNFTKLPPEGNL